MSNEKSAIISYEGKPINMFSDERDAYVNLTDMAKAWRGRKSIRGWMRNKTTIPFLAAWERKYNPKFNDAEVGTITITEKRDELSIKNWIDKTGAIGIFTRSGGEGGTYAHKDIAYKFAAWLSPEFELFLIEKIQELSQLEKQKAESALLTHEEIIELVKLKEVFKFVAHQEIVEDAHKEVFASRANSKNPYAEFNTWRNKILDISPEQIDERIKNYCKENNIALSNKVLKKPKREKILMFDSYETVRHAVWDFLTMNGEINALNLANLVRDIIRTEKGELFRINEDTLFESKQELGQFSDFAKQIGEMQHVKSAREVLAIREAQKKKLENPSSFNQKLLKALDYNPKNESPSE